MDGKGKQGMLARASKHINIGTLNVRTIREQHKRIELANTFCAIKNTILGIIDHTIVHEDEIEFSQYPQFILITSSAWRNSTGAACGGVGILINRTAEGALVEVTSYNERILVANFCGNPSTTVIVHYAPIEGSDDAEDHYNNLTEAVNLIPKHNLIVVMGDFNAHLGHEDSLFSLHEKTNSNGQRLLDLAEETNTVVTNTRFQKKRGKLWTYLSDMSGTKTQVDFILINKKWMNSVKNVEAYNSYSSLGSDHRVVTARIKLSLRICKTPKRKPNYNWDKLGKDADLQHQYTVTVKNRFSALQSTEDDATTRYQHFITANAEATKELIPTKDRQTRKNASKDT